MHFQALLCRVIYGVLQRHPDNVRAVCRYDFHILVARMQPQKGTAFLEWQFVRETIYPRRNRPPVWQCQWNIRKSRAQLTLVMMLLPNVRTVFGVN